MNHRRIPLCVIQLLAASLMVAQVPSYVPVEGLVAWYSFDGNGADASENGNDLVQIGDPLWGEVEGRPFVDLPGDGEHFYHPLDSFPVVEEFSIAMWVRIDVPSGSGAVGSVRPIASKHYSGSAGSFILYSGNGVIGGISHGWELGEWHHLVMTLSSTGRTYYFDGVWAAGNNDDSWSGTTYPFMIGGWLNQPWWSNNWSNSALSFDGGIGAVGVWDRVLTAEEVSTVFNDNIHGCTDVNACNYDSAADVDNGTCEYGCNYCGDGTEWNAALNECIAIGSVCGTGFTWNVEQQSCVPFEEICGPGTEWNSYSQTCVPDVTCISDLNLDGVVGSSDLLIMLAAFGLSCELSVDVITETCETTLEFDNYTYDIVSIGEQCWFAENLRSLHYANGDVIPHSMTAEEWASTTSGACAILWENTTNPILEGDQDTLDWALHTFGRLYNFYAVTDSRAVCPSGWHVSTDSDWFELETYLGLPEEELLLNNSSTRGSAIGLGHKLKDSQAWISPSLGYDCDGIQTDGTWLNTDYLTSDTRVYGPPVLNLLGTGRRIDEYFGWGYNSFIWSPDGEQPVWRYTLGHWGGMARAEPENALNQGNPVRCVKD